MASAIPLADVPPALTGGTVAIGNFDGVHRGHQSVLAAALAGPDPALALTFEPHPRAFFAGKSIFRLTPACDKAEIVSAAGLAATVVVPFDRELAALSAEEFIENVLVRRLNVRHVAVGHDFKFGARRSGSAETLAEAGARLGFGVTIVSPLSGAGDVISSSRIRALLAEGDVAAAGELLGYRYRVRGTVQHGEKRGRALGYPTANMTLAAENELRHGIYAVRVRIGEHWHDGVASFGRRPTFDNGAPLLETFLFDFSGDLYGQEVTVSLVRFLRPELKFDSLDALVAQMAQDSTEARAALGGLAPLSALDAAVNF